MTKLVGYIPRIGSPGTISVLTAGLGIPSSFRFHELSLFPSNCARSFSCTFAFMLMRCLLRLFWIPLDIFRISIFDRSLSFFSLYILAFPSIALSCAQPYVYSFFPLLLNHIWSKFIWYLKLNPIQKASIIISSMQVIPKGRKAISREVFL